MTIPITVNYLSIAAELEIDAICDEFEANLKAGNHPIPSQIVEAAPERLRDKLAAELNKILLEHAPREGAFTSAGQQIGPYTLEKRLGEGGMGEVWMAQQLEPVRRTVALKLIKPGMDSQAVLARFEQERQALAHLDHPNIARILDAGMTPQQRPFFVMEYLEGLHLNAYCDRQGLDVLQRLKLFMVLANTVHYAHQKGIIHRDLKPSNILVTQPDGQPLLKIIDFGVAKVLTGSLGQESVSTQPGSVVGTWEYMAPEQADYGSADVDTRADIYSLGVILYELLSGSRPFDSQRLRNTPWDQVIRIIREEDPPQPSTRLSANPSQTTVATCRQTDVKALTRQLQGDIDCIIMKCLEKDRTRRYESAASLRQDIERYLANEPVEASPPSARYRLRKFYRRNRSAVIAGSTIVMSIFAATLALSYGFLNAKAAEAKATSAAAETQLALSEVSFANDTIFDVFNDLDLRKVRQGVEPLEYVLAERLITASQRLTPDTIRDPATLLRLQQRLGLTLLSLDRPKAAIPVFTQARTMLLQMHGANHPDLIESTTNLAEAYREAGDDRQAMPLYQEAFSLAQSNYGKDDSRTMKCISNLASGHKGIGQIQQALPLFQQVFNWRKDRQGEDHTDTLLSSNNLAACYSIAGQRDLAVKLYERTLTLRQQKLGRDHPDTLVSLNNFASALQDVGQVDKALPLLEEAVELHRTKLGTTHRQTLMTMGNLAYAYSRKRRLAEAISLYERTINLRKVKLGSDHPDTLLGQNNLAFVYQEANQFNKAIQLFEETLEIQMSKFTIQHPDTLLTMNNLAYAFHTVGKVPEAIRLYESALQVQRTNLGAQHPQTQGTVGNLAVAYADANLGAKAVPLFDEFVQLKRTNPNLTEMSLAGTLTQIGQYLLTAKQTQAAEKYLRESLTIRQKLAADKWATFNTQALLGRALFLQRKLPEAETMLIKGYEGLLQKHKTIPASGVNSDVQAGQWLIELYTTINRPEQSRRIRDSLPIETAPLPRR